MKLKFDPLLYNELLDINEVNHVLSETDLKCIDEIKDVIVRYQLADRFGITLLHKHFDVGNQEVLVETVDPENRILTTRPILITEAKEKTLVQTLWCFSEDKSLERGCQSYCPSDSNGKHYGYKEHD